MLSMKNRDHGQDMHTTAVVNLKTSVIYKLTQYFFLF